MIQTKNPKVRKQVLDRIEGGYALMLDRGPAGEFLFVGSESKGGQSRLIRLDTGEVCTATDKVGGMMHILPVPGESGVYVAAMGMYAPFIGQRAAVYMLRAGAEWNSEWSVEKLFDMPFVHRLGFMHVDGADHLLVATVSLGKESPDDWSRPGGLYAVNFTEAVARGTWELQTVTEDIYRNHGMWAGSFDGEQSLLLSGAEGLFAIRPDSGVRGGFRLDPVIEEEISEMVAVDLDGDGVDEMVVIEPFHGHRLRVYKRGGEAGAGDRSGRWESVWKTEDLSFAHGLNFVQCGSRPLVLVGNRRAGMELLAFDFDGLSGNGTRYVLDEGVGPTQIEQWKSNQGTGAASRAQGSGAEGVRILSCNQGGAEVSLYEFSEADL
ncbi:MAG: hypothetical protein ACOCRN_03755 [Spirochaetia bacterium]